MYLPGKNLWAMLGMMLVLPPAMAAWAPSPAEMAALPPYCAARFNEGSAAFVSWKASMGPDFNHIHHYCVGLKLLNQAYGMRSSTNKEVLGAAVREMDYVLTHAAPDFYMRAEILMNRGIALSLAKRTGEAVGNLSQAIELDPKLSRAYMTLADVYIKQNNRSKALEIVSDGLRHNPETKSLQRRYTELGGKMPYPAAIEPAPASDNMAASPAETVSSQPADSVAPATASTPEEPFASPPAIGTPQNPYCRFCP